MTLSRRPPGGEDAFVRAQRLGHKVGVSATVGRTTDRTAVVQRDDFKVRDRGAPPYGWLTNLADYLNAEAGVGQWAFTGSFAMYCWAWVKDGVARTPEDVDILVAPSKFGAVALALYEAAGRPAGFKAPGGRSEHATVDATFEADGPTGDTVQVSTHVDIMRAGGRFGDLANVVQLDDGQRFPVVSIDDLIARKESVRQLEIMQEEADSASGKPAEETKAARDLRLLQVLKDQDLVDV